MYPFGFSNQPPGNNQGKVLGLMFSALLILAVLLFLTL